MKRNKVPAKAAGKAAAKSPARATTRDLHLLLGKNVRLYRGIMGWSQEGLAEKMGISKNTIHDIETGKKFVRAQNLLQFSDLFNIEVYKLFLPEELASYDTARVIASYTEEVKDALENLMGDFIKKNKKQ